MVVMNHRGLHLLSLASGRLARRAFVESGTRLDGWVLDPQSNTLLAVGDLTGDGAADFLTRSPWGIGVMSVGSDDRFRCRALHPHGAPLGRWPLESSDIIAGASTFMGSGRNELLIVKPWVGSAAAPPFAATEFRNWHRNIRRTLSTVRPANLAELVSAVRAIQARGDIAGVAGSGWSYTDCVVGDRTDALIDTSLLNGTIGNLVPDLIDDRTGDGRRLVHVEAGVKLYDLNCRLESLGLALPTMGGSRGQSLAGVLSTGVHGSDVSLPPIADAVRAIHLVGAGGQQWWIEPATGRVSTADALDHAMAKGILDPTIKCVCDDAWFNAVLVAMGCAGVIYSVVVECRPAFRLRETITSENWNAAKTRISDMSVPDRRPRFLEINVNPADSSCLVTVRNETTEPATPPAAGREGPSIAAIAAGISLVGPGALGLFFGAVGDYIARTSAEIAALGLVPFAGPFLQAQKTAEALRPVQDMHRLLIELGLAAVNPNDPTRVAAVLPTAINVLWAIGAWVVPGRALVDQLQAGITRQQRPVGTRVGKSYQIMTGQPSCSEDGAQVHDETQRLIESFEYAVPVARAVDFVNRLIAVTGQQRGGQDAVIVNLNLRFTLRSRATLAMQRFAETCHVEIYTFKGLRGNEAFKRRLQEVITEFAAVPHAGQLHTPADANVFRDSGALARWQPPIRALSGGSQMFWSSFALTRGFLP
jgi:FAD/FMN-containing dehydrogenase